MGTDRDVEGGSGRVEITDQLGDNGSLDTEQRSQRRKRRGRCWARYARQGRNEPLRNTSRRNIRGLCFPAVRSCPAASRRPAPTSALVSVYSVGSVPPCLESVPSVLAPRPVASPLRCLPAPMAPPGSRVAPPQSLRESRKLLDVHPRKGYQEHPLTETRR